MGNRAARTSVCRGSIAALGALMPAILVACGGPQLAPSATPAATAAETVTAAPPAPQIIEAIAVDASGQVYGSDCFRNTVYRFEDGRASVIAGTGIAGFSGDGGSATEAELYCPSGLAFVGDELYIVDDGNSRIRKVDGAGIITTVAHIRPAGALRGCPYEGGLMAAGIAIDAVGSIYVTDRANNLVRRIDPQGAITDFAGDGLNPPGCGFQHSPQFGGDGGPATQASLGVPHDVVVDATGNVYFTDLRNNRVRVVDAEGTIATYAGTGERTMTGDGGPADNATLCDPAGLAIAPDGTLYVGGDCGPDGHHVRRIDSDGIITTVAGIGSKGYSGDGGPAVDAEINVPSGLAIDASGTLYIGDVGNRCIRAVDAAGMIGSLWCAE